jgi:hypothetical protein
MAPSASVSISNAAVITALNTPGGAVYEWRDEIAKEIMATAFANSPVNDPLNAMHRGGVVGTYKASWDWDRQGSGGHHVVARVVNTADHAIYVERGRSGSSKMQIFSWTEWEGDIRRIGGPSTIPSRRGRRMTDAQRAYNARIRKLPRKEGERTGARAGQHILAKAVVAALGSQGIVAMTE